MQQGRVYSAYVATRDWVRGTFFNLPKPDMVRYRLELDSRAYQKIEEICRDGGITVEEYFRCAFALLKIVDEGKKAGNAIGFHSNPSVFDTLIIGVP